MGSAFALPSITFPSSVRSPESVDGSFWCNDNKLTNLIGSPRFVGGNFVCETCLLTSLLETINCDFKEKIFFNIDKKNFEQKELIQILGKYYRGGSARSYVLTYNELRDTIKPQIEKEILNNKLSKSKIKHQIKTPFL